MHSHSPKAAVLRTVGLTLAQLAHEIGGITGTCTLNLRDFFAALDLFSYDPMDIKWTDWESHPAEAACEAALSSSSQPVKWSGMEDLHLNLMLPRHVCGYYNTSPVKWRPRRESHPH